MMRINLLLKCIITTIIVSGTIIPAGNAQGIQFEESTFNEALAKARQQKKLLFIDCYTTWCGPCKMLAPTLDEVAAETAGKAAVYKLDIDQSPDIAQKYGVMSVPTLMVFENGQVKNQAVGVQPKQNILSMIG